MKFEKYFCFKNLARKEIKHEHGIKWKKLLYSTNSKFHSTTNLFGFQINTKIFKKNNPSDFKESVTNSATKQTFIPA